MSYSSWIDEPNGTTKPMSQEKTEARRYTGMVRNGEFLTTLEVRLADVTKNQLAHIHHNQTRAIVRTRVDTYA